MFMRPSATHCWWHLALRFKTKFKVNKMKITLNRKFSESVSLNDALSQWLFSGIKEVKIDSYGAFAS